MKKQPHSFVMDTRNVGGRQHVIENMLSHQSKLRAIVSDTRAGGGGGTPNGPKKSPSSSPTSFSSAPATYHMARSLSSQRARKLGRTLNEQERCDQSMLRRIDAYPLPAQRRQNRHDAKAHPVKLFRDAQEPTLYPTGAGHGHGSGLALPGSPRKLYEADAYSASLSAYGASSSLLSPPRTTGLPPKSTSHARQAVFRPDHFASAVPRSSSAAAASAYKRPALEIMEYTQGKQVSRRAVPTDSDHIEPGKRSPRRGTRPASATVARSFSQRGSQRPQSAHPSSNPAYSRYASEAMDDFTAGGMDGSDPYTKLKNKLFALIVEHRIFRERAILKLLDKARAINTHMNQAKLERVLEEIKIEFEIDPLARLDGDEPHRSHNSASSPTAKLDAMRRELRDVERDIQEETLEAKLDAAEAKRARSRTSDRDSRSRSASRSRSRSSSRSPRSRSASRSRSPSPRPRGARSRSRSPRRREEEF